MNSDNDFGFKNTLPTFDFIFDDIEHRILSPLSYLIEFDNYWKMEFDLPMVNKKDIKITFNQNTINVDAKLKEEYSEERLGEITKFEYFKKSITLPNGINIKKKSTKFYKGRLTIKIPKILKADSIQID